MHLLNSLPGTLSGPRTGPGRRPRHAPPCPGRGRDPDPLRALHARQRPDGDRAHRPQGAGRGGQPLVPRRLEEREAGQDGFRPPVRAPDVPGLGELQGRVLQALRAGRCHEHERHDQFRPHELLPERADHGPRPRAVDGVGPHGAPARGRSTRRGSTSSAASCRTRSARARTDPTAASGNRCSGPASRPATPTAGRRSARWRTSTPRASTTSTSGSATTTGPPTPSWCWPATSTSRPPAPRPSSTSDTSRPAPR